MRPVVIRADGANGIGLGHIRRCVEVGRVLKERGAHVSFVSASNSVVDPILAQFERPVVQATSEGAMLKYLTDSFRGSVIVLDTLHPYSALEIEWLKDAGCTVFMIQNDCPGLLASDYAVFPDGHHDSPSADWGDWGNTIPLVGLDYVIVPRAAKLAALHSEARFHVAVVAGASDPWRILPRMAELFCKLRGYQVVFLEGQDTDYHEEMVSLCDLGYMTSVPFNYFDLFSARMVITVFGCTAYELIYAGRPFLALGPNERYAHSALVLAWRTAAFHTLEWPCFSSATLELALSNLWNDRWNVMKQQGGLIDDAGAERIAYHILQEARRGN